MFKTNLKNMFTALCCTLTMYLICQLLLTYLVEKPTTTSEQKKDLELSDIPEVVVCLEPGLNSSSLEENGYHPTMYWRGVLQLDGEDFVGWSGGIGGNKSSHEILQEALLISDDQHSNKTKLIRFNGYSSHDFDAKMSNYIILEHLYTHLLVVLVLIPQVKRRRCLLHQITFSLVLITLSLPHQIFLLNL